MQGAVTVLNIGWLILLNGKFVSVLRKGEGKDILFLHGYLSCKESFYYQTEFFAAHGFRVTAPDFFGFGNSAALTEAYAVGDYARWLKDFITAARLDRPHIVAHSFGARVAFRLLSEDGSVADRLIVTGGAGLVKPRSPQYMRRVKRYRLVKKFFPAYAEKHFGSAEYRTLSPVMKESYKKIVNEDLRGCAARITNRTLLVYGADDTVTPKDEEGRTFNQLIKGSTLEIIGGGHFCFCENPQIFNALAYRFLSES